jgi:hypothetical protein
MWPLTPVAPIASALALAATAFFPPGAHASFLSPELMDKAAMGLAWFIVCHQPWIGRGECRPRLSRSRSPSAGT